MNRVVVFILVAIAFCQTHSLSAQLELNCDNDSTGMIPLTDMGFSKYGPYQGGLYPSYQDEMPITHLNKGKDLSNAMVPLNAAGEEDWVDGYILMVGMGGSTASNCYNAMIDTMKTIDYEGTNPCLKVKGLFYGGKDLQNMIDSTTSFYWDYLEEKLVSRDESWDQIQIVWMQTHSELDIDDSILFVKAMIDQYIELLHIMADSMANLKQVFLTGFHYTGYTHPSHSLYNVLAEPKAYWGNIAIKLLIERQILGDPLLAFEGPNRVAPYISWGPYFWADGANPRSTDGLSWLCSEFRDDDTGGGFHLEDPGKGKEALMLKDFFSTDQVASKWWLDAAKWLPCPVEERQSALGLMSHKLEIYPNPASDLINVIVPRVTEGALNYAVYDSGGNVVAQGNKVPDENRSFRMDIQGLPAGFYLIKTGAAGHAWTGKFFIQ